MENCQLRLTINANQFRSNVGFLGQGVNPSTGEESLGSGARFSKDPKLFGRISVDIILFVSSKRRRLEARNFAVIFIFIPFTTYEKKKKPA